ncbi:MULTISPECIES: hypothetical protein [unclassified Synechococcus]|uniref:hypothetical protein n=1 Tax=unclassified Synechococcus TaxID=2626047 RepID=UPI0021026244|nr:hypothetical protein [Synechococcus sp. MIT S9220]
MNEDRISLGIRSESRRRQSRCSDRSAAVPAAARPGKGGALPWQSFRTTGAGGGWPG